MGDFKQSILPHWDYMWKDRAWQAIYGDGHVSREKKVFHKNASENKKSI